MKTRPLFPANSVSWLVPALAIAGCASEPQPRESIAKAEMAIQDATRTGAAATEGALLGSAQRKYDQALQDMRNDHNVTARRLAEEAVVEARLASVRAAAAAQNRETTEMRKAVDAIKNDPVRTYSE